MSQHGPAKLIVVDQALGASEDWSSSWRSEHPLTDGQTATQDSGSAAATLEVQDRLAERALGLGHRAEPSDFCSQRRPQRHGPDLPNLSSLSRAERFAFSLDGIERAVIAMTCSTRVSPIRRASTNLRRAWSSHRNRPVSYRPSPTVLRPKDQGRSAAVSE